MLNLKKMEMEKGKITKKDFQQPINLQRRNLPNVNKFNSWNTK